MPVVFSKFQKQSASKTCEKGKQFKTLFFITKLRLQSGFLNRLNQFFWTKGLTFKGASRSPQI